MNNVFPCSYRKNIGENCRKMNTSFMLIKRNIKPFFNDKRMLFTALVTPVILLVLYTLFCWENVYQDGFTSNLPETSKLSESIVEGLQK